jgi:hypothetical protein
MYSLLFQNRWLAALWAGMLLVGIYLTTPGEGEPPSGAAMARMGTTEAFAERAGVPGAAAMRKIEDDEQRRKAIEAFNSDEAFVDDTDPATDEGY